MKDQELIELAKNGGDDKDLFFLNKINEVEDKMEEIKEEVSSKLDSIEGKEFPEFPEIPEVVFPDIQSIEGPVEITNFPDTQKIQGKVEVTNLKDLKLPTPQVNVEAVKIPDFPEIKIPEYPKQIKTEIINDQINVMLVDEDGKPVDLKKTGSGGKWNGVFGGSGMGQYLKKVDGTVINPATDDTLNTINSSITTTNSKLDTIDLTLTSGGQKNQIIDQYNTNNLDEATSTVMYVGLEDKVGNWWIKKVDTTSGMSIGHATILNNAAVANYAAAWAARASTLVYGNFSTAF